MYTLAVYSVEPETMLLMSDSSPEYVPAAGTTLHAICFLPRLNPYSETVCQKKHAFHSSTFASRSAFGQRFVAILCPLTVEASQHSLRMIRERRRHYQYILRIHLQRGPVCTRTVRSPPSVIALAAHVARALPCDPPIVSLTAAEPSELISMSVWLFAST